MTKHI